MLNTRALTRRTAGPGRTRPGAVAGLMIGSVLLGGGLFLAGCSAGTSSGAASSAAKAAAPANGEAASAPSAMASAPSAMASAPRAADQGSPGGQDAATTVRLAPASSIIYTAQLTVRAADVSAAAAQADR